MGYCRFCQTPCELWYGVCKYRYGVGDPNLWYTCEKPYGTSVVSTIRDCHRFCRYRYSSGFQHTMAHCIPMPQYHRYSWVYYSRVWIIFIVFFSYLIITFSANSFCHNTTKFGSVSHIFTSCHQTTLSSNLHSNPTLKQCKLLFHIPKLINISYLQ